MTMAKVGNGVDDGDNGGDVGDEGSRWCGLTYMCTGNSSHIP